jgi:hypothetical protein
VNGIAVHDGAVYLSQAGHPAALTRVDPGGSKQELVTGLAGPGEYHLNGPVVGPDQRLYFSQSPMTNSAIVGLDSLQLAWLHRCRPPTMSRVSTSCSTASTSRRPTPARPTRRRCAPARWPVSGSRRGRSARACGSPGDRSGPALCSGRVTARTRCLGPAQRLRSGIPARRAPARARPGPGRPGQPTGRQRPRPLGRGAHRRLVRLAGLHRRGADHRPEVPPGARPAAHVRTRQPRRPAATAATAGAVPAACGRHQTRHLPTARWAGQLAIAFFGDEAPRPHPTTPTGAARRGASRPVHMVDASRSDRGMAPADRRPLPPDPAEMWVLDFGEFEMTDAGPRARGQRIGVAR